MIRHPVRTRQRRYPQRDHGELAMMTDRPRSCSLRLAAMGLGAVVRACRGLGLEHSTSYFDLPPLSMRSVTADGVHADTNWGRSVRPAHLRAVGTSHRISSARACLAACGRRLLSRRVTDGLSCIIDSGLRRCSGWANGKWFLEDPGLT